MSMNEIIIKKLPFPLKNIAYSLFGGYLEYVRYGDAYKKIYSEIIKRDKWNEEQILQYQYNKLKRIISISVSSVPYYKNWAKANSFDIHDFSKIDDLKYFPIIDKITVQKNLKEFINENINNIPHRIFRTSGTTGTGLTLPISVYADQVSWATVWRFRQRFGIKKNMLYAHFFGRSFLDYRDNYKPFWVINYPGKQIFFSAYHIRQENITDYISALNLYRPQWIQGYPSILALLAGLMIDNKIFLNYRPDFISTSSETLLNHQRDLIERAFKIPCRQIYGQTESVACISECPAGHLHCDEDFGYIEFINGTIVATGFNNNAFPLIRYNTGDEAVVSSTVLCRCGLNTRTIKSIDGRIEDYIVTPEGQKIGRLDHVFKGFNSIREAQLYQPKINELEVRIVTNKNYTKKDEVIVLRSLVEKVGAKIDIKFRYLDSIPRRPNNKLRFVISNISNSI